MLVKVFATEVRDTVRLLEQVAFVSKLRIWSEQNIGSIRCLRNVNLSPIRVNVTYHPCDKPAKRNFMITKHHSRDIKCKVRVLHCRLCHMMVSAGQGCILFTVTNKCTGGPVAALPSRNAQCEITQVQEL